MPEVEISLAEEALATEIAQVINDAYAISEGDMWLDGVTRTTPDEVSELIRHGQMLAATAGGRVVGCASVQPLDDALTEVHFVSATPDYWGSGVGRALMAYAEELARSGGTRTLQLKLLVPTETTHPLKDRLGDWYKRLGFEVVGSMTVEQVSKQAVAEMAMPCEFLVFHKPLS